MEFVRTMLWPQSKFKSSKPKKRTVELGISSDSDDNIDEKDIVHYPCLHGARSTVDNS